MRATASNVQKILNAEDIEGLLELGAPPDEYSREAEHIAAALGQEARAGISEEDLVIIIRDVWAKSFGPLSDHDLQKRFQAFRSVAQRILEKIPERPS